MDNNELFEIRRRVGILTTKITNTEQQLYNVSQRLQTISQQLRETSGEVQKATDHIRSFDIGDNKTHCLIIYDDGTPGRVSFITETTEELALYLDAFGIEYNHIEVIEDNKKKEEQINDSSNMKN